MISVCQLLLSMVSYSDKVPQISKSMISICWIALIHQRVRIKKTGKPVKTQTTTY